MGCGWKERKKWQETAYEDFAGEFDEEILSISGLVENVMSEMLRRRPR
jgi:hypothetical protein